MDENPLKNDAKREFNQNYFVFFIFIFRNIGKNIMRKKVKMRNFLLLSALAGFGSNCES